MGGDSFEHNCWLFLLPVYYPAQADGQFFQVQCIQSSEPNMPGKPLASPSARSRSMSALVGWRRYSSPKLSFAAVQNRFKHLMAVLSAIRMYSSIVSADTP